MDIVLVVLGVLIVLFLAVTFGGGYYMYRYAIVRDKKAKNFWVEEIAKSDEISDSAYAQIKEGERFIKGLTWEKVSIKSHDGLTLVGHVHENSAQRGVFIMVHGYKSAAVYDFSCAVGPMMEMGFSILLIEQRAHGESEGKRIGFGALERYDVVRWAEYAGERWGGLPVVLDGVSMGSSTVMMGGENGYPENVRALICDCGYTTPGAICRITLKRWFNLPPFPIYYGAKIFTRLLAGYDLDGVSSADGLRALAEKKVPILIAHGRADGFVPFYMGEENFAAAREGNAEFFVSEEADHALAYLCDRDGYTAAMHRLFDKAGI